MLPPGHTNVQYVQCTISKLSGPRAYLVTHKCIACTMYISKSCSPRASILTHKCTFLATHKCTFLVTHKCTSLVAQERTFLVTHKCTSLVAHKCTSLVGLNCTSLVAQERTSPVTHKYQVSKLCSQHASYRGFKSYHCVYASHDYMIHHAKNCEWRIENAKDVNGRETSIAVQPVISSDRYTICCNYVEIVL